jgi:hypothetical protein
MSEADIRAIIRRDVEDGLVARGVTDIESADLDRMVEAGYVGMTEALAKEVSKVEKERAKDAKKAEHKKEPEAEPLPAEPVEDEDDGEDDNMPKRGKRGK